MQTAWRGWMLRKVVNSTIKLQAFWRGFLARKRYYKVLSRLQFVDDDDFEYVAVNENEFVLNSLVFEDEYSVFCKLQASKELSLPENMYKSKTSSTNANLMVELVEEGNGSFLSRSHETCLFSNISKQKGNIKVSVICENDSSIKNREVQCKQTRVQSKPMSKRLNALELARQPLFDNASNFVLVNEVQILISFNCVFLFFMVIFYRLLKMSCPYKFVFIKNDHLSKIENYKS